MDKFCMDCGNPIVSPKAVRCRSCSSKFAWTKPESILKARKSALEVARNKPELRKFRSDMMRRVNTPELKAKKKEIAERMWNDPITRQKLVDGIARSDNKGNNKPSKLELRFGRHLEDLGLTYKPQFRPKGLPRYYDFLLNDLNLIIEVDGDYWHHSDRAISRGVELDDDTKNIWALANGYNLIRFRESDLISIGFEKHIDDGLHVLLDCEQISLLIYHNGWKAQSAVDVVALYDALYTTSDYTIM